MPIITVALLNDHSQTVKAIVAREITTAIENYMKIDPDKILIRFEEIKMDDFAVGGRLKSQERDALIFTKEIRDNECRKRES